MGGHRHTSVDQLIDDAAFPKYKQDFAVSELRKSVTTTTLYHHCLLMCRGVRDYVYCYYLFAD